MILELPLCWLLRALLTVYFSSAVSAHSHQALFYSFKRQCVYFISLSRQQLLFPFRLLSIFWHLINLCKPWD